MNRSQILNSLLVVITIGSLSAGCGNQKVSVSNSGTTAENPGQRDKGILDLNEEDFMIVKEETGIVAFVYNKKVSPIIDAEHLTSIRIHSAALAHLEFNMQDFYVDGYTAGGYPVPFIQLQLANKELTVKRDEVTLPLDGGRLANLVKVQKRFIEHESEDQNKMGRQELRVLLSDDSQAGNPIIAGVLIPL